MQTDSATTEVRRLARQLLSTDVLEVSFRVSEHVMRCVPDLAPAGVPDAVAVVHESTNQNIGAIFSTLAFGVSTNSTEPPAGTQELITNLETSGGDVTHLLHAYRAGHRLLWQLWSEFVCTQISSNDLLPDTLAISSAHIFDFIDQACQQITLRAPVSGFRSSSTSTDSRLTLVRSVLAEEHIHLAAVSTALSYDLSAFHVAFVATAATDGADVRSALEQVLSATGRPALAAPAPDGSWWGWIGFTSPPSGSQTSQLAGTEVTDAVIGMGSASRGRHGFRLSHRQALCAKQVATLAPSAAGRVVQHREVELTALLCSDPDSAGNFCRDRLGRLAGRDDATSRLRATVRAVLTHGNNRAVAARVLHLHHKTIAYRLAQAETLLGRPLAQDTLELQAALVIDEVLNGP